MNENDFKELLGAMREMREHREGRADLPDESVHVAGEPDPRAVRRTMRLSQEDFAYLLGVSTRTLQNREQGRRRPTGSAMQLLRIAERHPDILLEIA